MKNSAPQPAPAQPVDAAAVCQILATGQVQELGFIPGASNDTRLIVSSSAGQDVLAVYKPIAGERPLADFPPGTLAHREVAAFKFGHYSGLDVVPPTVLRNDLPAGPGSVQAYVEAGEDELVTVFPPAEVPAGWSAIFSAVLADETDVVVAHAQQEGLRAIALFDIVTNNADRKAGHVIAGNYLHDGRPAGVFGIDNGLTFHHGPKLRTLLWGFSGSPFTAAETQLLTAVSTAANELHNTLGQLLAAHEIASVIRRAEFLLELGEFPAPPSTRRAIPWPPF